MSTSDTKKLKQYCAQRQTEIGKLADIKKVADESLLNSAKHANFKCRYKHLEESQEIFCNLHKAIISILATQDGSDVDEHHQIYSEFMNDFYHVQAIYSQIFTQDSNLAINSTANNTVPNKNVKLPKIELPKFNGEPRNWQTFIDMYESLIHDNAGLSNIDKFNYLISSLQKEPLALVRRTPLTGQNYLVAYNALIKRYDNKRLIATSHWHAIEQSKKLTADTAHELRILIDCFQENLSLLDNLGYETVNWDFPLFNMLFDKLDSSTATSFELECNKDLKIGFYYPTLIDFLQKRCQALDTVSSNAISHKPVIKSRTNNFSVSSKPKLSSSFVSHTQKGHCQLCKSDHFIYNCPTFLAQNANDRYSLVKNNRWCSNCLGSRHSTQVCSSSVRCKKCSGKHHTLLHFDKNFQPNHIFSSSSNTINHTQPTCSSANIACAVGVDPSGPSVTTGLLSHVHSTVLLSTAIIEVQGKHGVFHKVRAVLDSASQSNFISSKCAARLGLSRYNLSISISGIAQTDSFSKQGLSCIVKPVEKKEPTFHLDFVVLPQICSNMPEEALCSHDFSQFSTLSLADPLFHKSQPVDMLLGADIFGFLLTGKSLNFGTDRPIALETVFGWVVMGKVVPSPISIRSASFLASTEISLDSAISKFWELEQVPDSKSISSEDGMAENHFKDTCQILENGKFQVCLPFRNDEPTFSGIRNIALRRYFSLERKLSLNPSLQKEYHHFMLDYLNQEHMSLVNSDLLSDPHTYYIPHFCVLRPDSSTTKLRVVFDASTKDLNSLSLNDTLLTGPKLQQDLNTILIRFRFHKYVFTADIRQMYRQIQIHPKHRKYQRILWRFSKDEPIRDYELNTVTYGVNSSPYLAIRTLHQLADDYKDTYPLASEVILENTYIDDASGGANDLAQALLIQNQLISLLSLGQFQLRKWASNNPDLISHLPSEHRLVDPLAFDKESTSLIKILGLQWDPSSDNFSYSVLSIDKPCTKRNILSQVARIFDPLGFLTPITFLLKTLLQRLWIHGSGWDDPPPSGVQDVWNRFVNELPFLQDLRIPRFILPTQITHCSLHGFSDASEAGYAAVIYIRCLKNHNDISIKLILAKSRVAPIKKISIPRLELCGALLLSSLLKYLLNIFEHKLKIDEVTAWTDSSIVMSWIHSSPHKWCTFVSNRVSQIQENLAPSHWRHIKSSYNPADVSSRGLSPQNLLHNDLWWSGPKWLQLPEVHWPNDVGLCLNDITVTAEDSRKIVLLASPEIHIISALLVKFSSLLKIQRILAFILRFLNNCRSISPRLSCGLSLSELETSLFQLIKFVQNESFKNEINLLKNNKTLPKYLRRLTPFLDPSGMLRVGGRLVNASLSQDQKHPILLPSSHRFTQLLIEHTHTLYLHPGLQTLHNILVQRYWILSSKRVIRSIIAKCLKCFKLNPQSHQPIMGNLPPQRISQVKPFAHTGVDLAGPISITLKRFRGAKVYKAYICIFVCMAIKAVHIELISDMSSETFIAAFRRFVARRGRCNHLYCDSGTNFVGASNHFKSIVENIADTNSIEFHFNCPKSPNFGGLWESQIKVLKTHLFRVIGNQILTFEEMTTLLVQIEAVMNSRPLCPISSDPNDLSPLTPGHFLTLEPLNSPPDLNLGNVKLTHLSRWQLVQQLHQSFWNRWKTDYLHTLIQRRKWTNPSTPIDVGTMVVIKDDASPPLQWVLGKIMQVHPGSDNVTRVVSVKTSKGILRRPTSKVCPLPQSI